MIVEIQKTEMCTRCKRLVQECRCDNQTEDWLGKTPPAQTVTRVKVTRNRHPFRGRKRPKN